MLSKKFFFLSFLLKWIGAAGDVQWKRLSQTWVKGNFLKGIFEGGAAMLDLWCDI